MLNIIKADLYKYFRRPFLFILAIFFLIMAIAVPLVLKSFDETAGTKMNILNTCGGTLSYISIIVIIFASVLSEEYSENTLKNTLSCNISKVKFIMGKFIFQALICIFLFIISLVAFL